MKTLSTAAKAFLVLMLAGCAASSEKPAPQQDASLTSMLHGNDVRASCVRNGREQYRVVRWSGPDTPFSIYNIKPDTRGATVTLNNSDGNDDETARIHLDADQMEQLANRLMRVGLFENPLAPDQKVTDEAVWLVSGCHLGVPFLGSLPDETLSAEVTEEPEELP